MKASFNWLKEFVDIDIDPEELAEELTMAGLEVAKIDYHGKDLEDVIVARIDSVRSHPNADKLVLCDVDTGEETVQVVCGAKNMKAGDRVALARPGTKLPGGMELKKAKIRGEVSNGMLCSEIELNLGEDAAGIMILPEEYPIGSGLAQAMEDAVFDIEITPNRPDCLSILGVAREVGAILNKKLRLPEIDFPEGEKSAEKWTSITIDDYDLCPRYAARIITDVSVGSSPPWMQQRLQKCGIRAINNVVDATNYALLELGHPLHAFDYEKLAENRIVVRRARAGEKIASLDGEERKLSTDVLVIADAQKPVAIAGVMGGANSEVSEDTKIVLLESAYFQPASIRRTSKKLGLSSEASYRFERGADPGVQVTAANRVCQILMEIAGGKVAKGVIDDKKAEQKKHSINLRIKRLNDILGTQLAQSEIEEILCRLQLEVADSKEETLKVTIPTFRVDLEREIDLVEEVGRIYGYRNIPTPTSRFSLAAVPPNPIQHFETTTKNILTGFGLYETISCNLIIRRSLENIGTGFFDSKRLLSVLSSKSGEQNILRPTLLPGMLETVGHNLRQNQVDIKIFELGRAHLGVDEGFPVEKLLLSLAMTGNRRSASWDTKHSEVDFFDLKGVIEQYLERTNIKDVEFQQESNPFFRGGQGACILLEGSHIGAFGEVSREIAEHFDIDVPVFVAEFDTELLLPYLDQPCPFEQFSVFPSTSRDIALVVEESVSYRQIWLILDRWRKGIVSEIKLFDLYRGKQIGQGKKSLAVSITYKAKNRTLKDEEVEKVHSQIKKALIRELKCEIRE